jgi:hypothetical protein
MKDNIASLIQATFGMVIERRSDLQVRSPSWSWRPEQTNNILNVFAVELFGVVNQSFGIECLA